MKTLKISFIVFLTFFVFTRCKEDNFCVRSNDCPDGQKCVFNRCVVSDNENEEENSSHKKHSDEEDMFIYDSSEIKDFFDRSEEETFKDTINKSDTDIIDIIEEQIDEKEENTASAITWENSIKYIFQKRCVHCHPDMATYEGVVYYIEVKKNMKYYIEIGHYIWGDEQQKVLQWLDNGYPKE